MPLVTRSQNPGRNAVLAILVGFLVLLGIFGALFAAAQWAGPAKQSNADSEEALDTPASSRPVTTSSELDSGRILEIARAAVKKHESWSDKAKYQEPIKNPGGGGWTVIVWRQPESTKQAVVIGIDDQGEVRVYRNRE